MREAIVTGIQVAITFAVLIGLVAVVALFISWAWSNRSAPTLTTPATVQPVPTIRIDMPPSYNRFRDGDVLCYHAPTNSGSVLSCVVLPER